MLLATVCARCVSPVAGLGAPCVRKECVAPLVTSTIGAHGNDGERRKGEEELKEGPTAVNETTVVSLERLCGIGGALELHRGDTFALAEVVVGEVGVTDGSDGRSEEFLQRPSHAS